MRHRFLPLLSTLLLSALAAAQTPVQKPAVRVMDGGTSGRMESIFIPPKPNAPFSLTLATEWTRSLGSGGSFTVANERRIVRDSTGRIYQERWILVPKGGKLKSWMDIFQITDPVQHTWYNCQTKSKICELLPYSRLAETTYKPAIFPSGPLPDGSGFRQHEDLGAGSADGVDTHGYRETTTINAGVMGNDQPMVTVREFWFSPQLGIDLVSKVDTPDTGKQFFTVKNLTTSEPEPSFFAIPEGYSVVDHRNDKE